MLNISMCTEHQKQTVTIWPMFSPEMLGFLPMAHRRQSTSWMVRTFSSSFFFSGSLVTMVTSRPLSVLHTDFTWEFFQRSMPVFCSSLVQFVLRKLSKFLRTYRERDHDTDTDQGFYSCKASHFKLVFVSKIYAILTPVCRIMRDVLEPSVHRIPAISTAI